MKLRCCTLLAGAAMVVGPLIWAALPVQQFTVEINGTPYTRSATISPQLPIYALFRHPDPQVTGVKMQHPNNASLYRILPLGKKVRIGNHEGHMRAGHDSTSVFLAIDETGKTYGSITLTFKP